MNNNKNENINFTWTDCEDNDIFNNGKTFMWVAGRTISIQKFVRELSYKIGHKCDWAFTAGRAHIDVLEEGLSAALDVIHNDIDFVKKFIVPYSKESYSDGTYFEILEIKPYERKITEEKINGGVEQLFENIKKVILEYSEYGYRYISLEDIISNLATYEMSEITSCIDRLLEKRILRLNSLARKNSDCYHTQFEILYKGADLKNILEQTTYTEGSNNPTLDTFVDMKHDLGGYIRICFCTDREVSQIIKTSDLTSFKAIKNIKNAHKFKVFRLDCLNDVICLYVVGES